MNGNDLRLSIASALSGFAKRPLPEAARDLFASLGYGSERRIEFPSLAACFAEFDRENKAAKFFAEISASKRADAVLVQQLTSAEIASGSDGQVSLFKPAGIDPRQFDSYLFFAVPLPAAEYSRTELAVRARAINGLFPQPVLVLFRHGANISLAITYRRTSKRDQSRDVIERKVTLIKGIACASPHPGHLAILEDFSLASLSKARSRDIRNFADLDDAWRESLSTQLLNQKFYDEIANWYFWARELWKKDEIKLPADIKTEADASLFLIRLLTRLIFCWFLREKTNPQTGQGLIPDELYDPRRLACRPRDGSSSRLADAKQGRLKTTYKRCRVREATLGRRCFDFPQPQRGCVSFTVRRAATPLGLGIIFHRAPRVARAAQPWAERRYPVGVNARPLPATH